MNNNNIVNIDSANNYIHDDSNKRELHMMWSTKRKLMKRERIENSRENKRERLDNMMNSSIDIFIDGNIDTEYNEYKWNGEYNIIYMVV